jgi:hypothetical protein
MTVAVLASRLSDLGTIIGAGATAAVSGGAAALYEHLARKAPGMLRRRGVWFTLRHAGLHVSLRLAAGVAGSALLVAGAGYGSITLTEAALGRTLHSVTSGSPDYGTSLGGSSPSSPGPSPQATIPVPVPSLSVSPPLPSLTPSPAASLTPSLTPAPSPSPSPYGTPSLVPLLPSPAGTTP